MARTIGKTGDPDIDLVINRIQIALREIEPEEPIAVTGTMTSPTLTQLTAVVQSLLDALGASGQNLIDDQTT